MEKEFVTYEQALALNELGFDDLCAGYYADNILYVYEIENKNLYNGAIVCPLKQQVFRWFREKYELIYFIGDDFGGWSYSVSKNSKIQGSISNVYKTYEETELGCINKLIEIVKNK